MKSVWPLWIVLLHLACDSSDANPQEGSTHILNLDVKNDNCDAGRVRVDGVCIAAFEADLVYCIKGISASFEYSHKIDKSRLSTEDEKGGAQLLGVESGDKKKGEAIETEVEKIATYGGVAEMTEVERTAIKACVQKYSMVSGMAASE